MSIPNRNHAVWHHKIIPSNKHLSTSLFIVHLVLQILHILKIQHGDILVNENFHTLDVKHMKKSKWRSKGEVYFIGPPSPSPPPFPSMAIMRRRRVCMLLTTCHSCIVKIHDWEQVLLYVLTSGAVNLLTVPIMFPCSLHVPITSFCHISRAQRSCSPSLWVDLRFHTNIILARFILNHLFDIFIFIFIYIFKFQLFRKGIC